MQASERTTVKRLSDGERERYRRQMMLAGFSEEHQRRLKNSTALVAGVGGLGGTAAAYLAVAGIGRLVLVHYGNLTLSNMNRQILMKHSWIGRPRVEMALRTINEINPDVEVETHDKRISGDNAEELLGGVQIALSARPNFHERRTLSEACVKGGVPMVEAAMNGMQGYLFNVIPGTTPCLSCVYPEDDPQWEELGFPVLGAVSGLLGCMMAVEAIKILSAYRRALLSKMLIFDSTSMDFGKLELRRNENCPVCGNGGQEQGGPS